jgi:hypothetical protein
MKRLLTATLAATALFGLVACGSDSKSSGGGDTASQSTDASDDTSGGGSDDTTGGGGAITVPPVAGVTAECQAIVNAMSGAAAAFSGQGDAAQTKAMFAALEGAMPDELKDDARIFAEAYGKYFDLLTALDDPSKAMSDPEVLAAMQAIGTPEVQAATDNISAYMDEACPST